jgi:hypothetical protein
MVKWVLTSLILVLASGCENSFSARMTADYFPLKEGNKWVYNVQGNNNYQIEMEVISVEKTDTDSLFSIDVGGEIQLFERKSGNASRKRELFTTYEGEKVTFGIIDEPYLLLPPIENEHWEKEFRFNSIYSGDTIEKVFLVTVDSVTSTSIVLNSGNYKNVYRLRRTIIEDNDSLIQYEWFAPNIGLIKKEILTDSVLWELASYAFDE